MSGFALERALVAIYEPRLVPYGLRMQMLPAHEANRFLATLDADIKATKVDLFLERETADGWRIPMPLVIGEYVDPFMTAVWTPTPALW